MNKPHGGFLSFVHFVLFDSMVLAHLERSARQPPSCFLKNGGHTLTDFERFLVLLHLRQVFHKKKPTKMKRENTRDVSQSMTPDAFLEQTREDEEGVSALPIFLSAPAAGSRVWLQKSLVTCVFGIGFLDRLAHINCRCLRWAVESGYKRIWLQGIFCFLFLTA